MDLAVTRYFSVSKPSATRCVVLVVRLESKLPPIAFTLSRKSSFYPLQHSTTQHSAHRCAITVSSVKKKKKV